MQQNILVTGASGFVGSAFCSELSKRKINFIPVYRHKEMGGVYIEGIGVDTDWEPAFSNNISSVVHTAARVHVMKESAEVDPLDEFRKVNTYGTISLAKAAAKAGVKRFIFISSIKVNGEFTELGSKFQPHHNFVPTDPYGLSKYEAELALIELSKTTEMEIVIIRPPLIYGPNVKANFRSMLKWINKRVPLPFGKVQNKRSMVSITNLVDFIICCTTHQKAANETFIISDFQDVSTTEILEKIGQAFGRKARLLPVPVSVMSFAANLIGKSAIADRVFGNLQVDSSKAKVLLNWKPVVSMDTELKSTVGAYLNEKNI